MTTELQIHNDSEHNYACRCFKWLSEQRSIAADPDTLDDLFEAIVTYQDKKRNSNG